jgi:hypothetical protein
LAHRCRQIGQELHELAELAYTSFKLRLEFVDPFFQTVCHLHFPFLLGALAAAQ